MAQYTSRAQKRVGSDTRGAKHQLLVDRAVSRDSKNRKTNPCTSWIDYKINDTMIGHLFYIDNIKLYMKSE